MVFPALALLLWHSPPARVGARVLVGVGAVYAALWFALPGGLVDQTLKAWLAIATVLFVAFARRGTGRPIDQAIGAGLLAAGAVLLWYFAYHLTPHSALSELEHQLRTFYRRLGDLAPLQRDALNSVSEQAIPILVTTPGTTMLIGMSGLLTAWRWYHILATAPVGTPPGPFREFTFSDHVVWLLVAGMAGVVAQLQGMVPDSALWPANLLVVSGVLYLVRGFAVLRWRAGSGPGPLLLVIATLILFPLIPFVVTGLFGIGLADTWLDFRRPPAPASGE